MVDPDDERLLALADAQRRTDERIEALADAVDALAQAVMPGGAADVDDAAVSVPWWPDLDADARAEAWAELIGWLNDALLPRHSDLGRTLTPCWVLHPSVIDELAMLHATWHNAYQGRHSSPSAVGEWLDRWLPNARRRIETELKECQRRDHVALTGRDGRDGTSLPAPKA